MVESRSYHVNYNGISVYGTKNEIKRHTCYNCGITDRSVRKRDELYICTSCLPTVRKCSLCNKYKEERCMYNGKTICIDCLSSMDKYFDRGSGIVRDKESITRIKKYLKHL